MDVDKIVVNYLADGAVVCNIVGKEQTPWAPVASYLANYIFPFGLSLATAWSICSTGLMSSLYTFFDVVCAFTAVANTVEINSTITLFFMSICF